LIRAIAPGGGVYPTDHIDSVKEREDLVKLAKINPRKYLEEIKKWGISRMDSFSAGRLEEGTCGTVIFAQKQKSSCSTKNVPVPGIALPV